MIWTQCELVCVSVSECEYCNRMMDDAINRCKYVIAPTVPEPSTLFNNKPMKNNTLSFIDSN